MAKIDIGTADMNVRRSNIKEGEGDNARIVGVDHYVLSLTGEGDHVLARVKPEVIDEAFAEIINDRVAARIEGLRNEVAKAVEDVRSTAEELETRVNTSVRGWQHALGIGNPPKKSE